MSLAEGVPLRIKDSYDLLCSAALASNSIDDGIKYKELLRNEMNNGSIPLSSFLSENHVTVDEFIGDSAMIDATKKWFAGLLLIIVENAPNVHEKLENFFEETIFRDLEDWIVARLSNGKRKRIFIDVERGCRKRK